MGLWWERANLGAGVNIDLENGRPKSQEGQQESGQRSQGEVRCRGAQAGRAEPGCGLAQRAGLGQEAGHQSQSRIAKGYCLNPLQRSLGFPGSGLVPLVFEALYAHIPDPFPIVLPLDHQSPPSL